MPIVSKYCCAYPASRLRAYDEWTERLPPLRAAVDGASTAAQDSAAPPAAAGDEVEYYFVHDNFIVTAGIWVDEQIAFDAVSEKWRRFCLDVLAFEVPEDVASA